MWTTFLDPRFSKNIPHWDSDGEKDASEEILIYEAVVMADNAVDKSNSPLVVPVVKVPPTKGFGVCFDTIKKKMVSTSINNSYMTNKKSCIKHEVNAYLIDTNNNARGVIPLEWWSLNGVKYWNVDRVAQKWLAVPETSTISKRVFLICRLVDTVKRSSLLGVLIEKQVFQYNYIDQFNSLQKYRSKSKYSFIKL